MQDTNAPDLLLETARRAIQRGQTDRARAVLRALTIQYPEDVRIWEALADVATDQQERQLVLEHLAERHTVAVPVQNIATEQFADQQFNEELQLPLPVRLMPREQVTPERAPVRWPTYLVIGLTVLVIAALALWRWFPNGTTATNLDPTQAIGSAPLPTLAAGIPVTTALVEVPTEQLIPTEAPIVAATLVSPSMTPLPPIGPTATPRPSLPVARVIQSGFWNVALLRPEYALMLDGSIGPLQPRGRFVLALLAIGNTSDSAARIPQELVALQDEQGNRYSPVPAASTAYLETYGRGQTGDLSFEEPIPADAGNLSVPILFDVPANAHGLQIVVGDAPVGWAVPGS